MICRFHIDRFQPRWSNYKSCQRHAADGGTTNQNYFHQHFLSDGHNGLMNDCEIIFKDKTDFSDPTRREFFWMRVLKTIAPSVLILMKVTIISFDPQLTPSRHVICYDSTTQWWLFIHAVPCNNTSQFILACATRIGDVFSWWRINVLI